MNGAESKNSARLIATSFMARWASGAPRTSRSANVRASVAQLSYGSRILEELTRTDRLHIVGAVYAVETGQVSILD